MKNRIVAISLVVALTLSVGLIACAGEEVPETIEYNLTISSTEGGSATAPGEGTFTYDEGEVVNLVADADEGYQFISWTGDVATIVDDKNPTTTITMNADYIITADFGDPTTQRATILIDGNPDDWSSLEPALVDLQGDSICGADADIKRIYTAMDDSYAYVMVETYGMPIYESAVIEINFDYKAGKHHVHGSACCDDLHTNISDCILYAINNDDLDGVNELYPIIGYVCARGDVMELSIPLSEIENATWFNPTFVNIWDDSYQIDLHGCDGSTVYFGNWY